MHQKSKRKTTSLNLVVKYIVKLYLNIYRLPSTGKVNVFFFQIHSCSKENLELTMKIFYVKNHWNIFEIYQNSSSRFEISNLCAPTWSIPGTGSITIYRKPININDGRMLQKSPCQENPGDCDGF